MYNDIDRIDRNISDLESAMAEACGRIAELEEDLKQIPYYLIVRKGKKETCFAAFTTLRALEDFVSSCRSRSTRQQVFLKRSPMAGFDSWKVRRFLVSEEIPIDPVFTR